MSPTGGLSLRRAVAAALLLFAALVCLVPASARAARVHQLLASETLPYEARPEIVSVNQSTGHIFVDASRPFSPAKRWVFELEPSGRFAAELEAVSAFEPTSIAVDNSGTATDGDIYVVNYFSPYGPETTPAVRQFDAAGEPTGVTITDASIPAGGTAQGGGLPPVVNDGSWNPRALAVGPSGDLYVNDIEAAVIDRFTAAGAFVSQFAPEEVLAQGMAVDAAGDLYMVNDFDREAIPGALGGLVKIDPATGECVPASCEPIDPSPAYGVAVDDSRGKIFTVGRGSGEAWISEYEASTGELLARIYPEELHSPADVAVDEASGDLVVADELPFREGTVQVYGPVEVVPDVTTLAPEAVTDRSATLRGEIGAAEVAGATCAFQYADAEEFEAHGFQGASEAPCEPAGPFAGSAMHAVEADVSGLRGGTEYHQRLVGVNENGSDPGADVPFTTAGPAVSGAEATEVGQSAATLVGRVDPRGAATAYRFQYTTRARYEAEGWAGATEVPAGGESVGEGEGPVAVSERIEGLAPGGAYRFRILARSSGGGTAGETEGEAVAFSTFAPSPVFGACPNEAFRLGRPAGALPDCRAYEQASPTEKNGVGADGEFNAVAASPDGSRITFISNSGIPGGEGTQQFPTYLAGRGADGWSTQGLLPPASYGPRAAVLGWSEDLEDVYDFATPAFEAGKLLRRPSAGGALVEAGTIEATGNPLAFAGSSRGGAVALLESRAGGLLPEDLEGRQNVYAYDRASGRLVLAGVMNDGSVPAAGAMAGPYDWYVKKSTSAVGGALGRYFTQDLHAISADGKKVFFTAGGTGQLYVRVNPTAVPEELGAEACLAGEKACTVRISAPQGVADPETPAAFVGATADGRYAFFLDSGKLTADATGGSGYDLYRYDLATGALADLTRDSADKRGARVEGVLGIGGGGQDVYFAAVGKLDEEASEAPSGETNIYALEGTETRLIARVRATKTGPGEEEPYNWVPTAQLSGGDCHHPHLPGQPRRAHPAVPLLAPARRLRQPRGRRALPLPLRGGGLLHLLQPDRGGPGGAGGGAGNPQERGLAELAPSSS